MTSVCAESLVRAGHPLHAIITEASPSYHGDDAMSFTMKNAPPSLMPAMVKLLLSASRSQDPEGFNARHTSDMLQVITLDDPLITPYDPPLICCSHLRFTPLICCSAANFWPKTEP
jgi:hypothetical protein